MTLTLSRDLAKRLFVCIRANCGRVGRLLVLGSAMLFSWTADSNSSWAQTLEESLLKEQAADLGADARRVGDPVRGAAIFYSRAMACSTCHSVGDRPEAIGPDLAKIDAKTSDAALVEALLEPSKTIAAAYSPISIETSDGRVLMGLLVEETEELVVLRDAAETGKLIVLKKTEIAERQAAKQSIMPAGQVNQLANRNQFLNLVRYLIYLRDGGPKRARQLQPPPDPAALTIPDEPLPWQPVVQRGEVTVADNAKYPHGVALGFDGGTVLFDANQLRPVALWFDGFVKHSQQNYFGLYWHRDGEIVENMVGTDHPLRFQLAETGDWEPFEPTTTSDPNTGTKFDGYQVGKSAVRLHYRVLVGGRRVTITEDIRAESRTQWRGYSRLLTFAGLPAGAKVSLATLAANEIQGVSVDGAHVASLDDLAQAPMISFRASGGPCVLQGQASTRAKWLHGDAKQGSTMRLIAEVDDNPLVLRLDTWHYRGGRVKPAAGDFKSLAASPSQFSDTFDRSVRSAAPLPLAAPKATPRPIVQRAAVQPQENFDEFPTVRGRYLRFVVTGVTNNSEPGIDELEVYGADPKVNLALQGTATASSVIKGYAIHQIPHLNDGKLGNNHSWISGESGGGWAQIEFPEPVEMQKIVWARDRTGISKDRLATAYRIEVSDDGKTWRKVGDQTGRAAIEGGGVVRRDASPGYVMESIPAPFPSWRPSDIAFGEDGTMYAIAMTEGQIWRTRTPPVGHPEQVEWQRYASGLYHPIGLAIVDGRLFVAQKPEITELVDQDGDGTVDQYRTVATGWGLSTGWHEYCFGLAVDRTKNLWFALNTGYFWTNPGYVNPGRWRGSVMRVARDTEKLEVIAKGCRVPNGIAQGPEGNIFFTDNQGDWIQACKLACVVPGRFYGHPETKDDALASEDYPDGRSAVWLPYERCRSVSGPVHDQTGGKFGPFVDQMFVGDVGYGANAGVMRIALEKVNGEYQGACFGFIDGQPQGCERMKFGPDQQLYMTSLTTGLTRVAYSGKMPFAIHAVNIRPQAQGFVVKLTKPLAEDAELKPDQFRVQQYHYLYTGNYGSPKADEKNVSVEKVELSPDRSTITLTLPVESYPIGMVYQLNLGNLKAADGETLLHNEAWYTVHNIPD
jgi:putative heme-binding domain-containing protein